MFKDDQLNGKGKIIDKDGNIINEGNFKDGVFIPKKKKDKDKKNNDELKENEDKDDTFKNNFEKNKDED